jgi:hypothetical protein
MRKNTRTERERFQEKHAGGGEKRQNDVMPAKGTEGKRVCFYKHVLCRGGMWKKRTQTH